MRRKFSFPIPARTKWKETNKRESLLQLRFVFATTAKTSTNLLKRQVLPGGGVLLEPLIDQLQQHSLYPSSTCNNKQQITAHCCNTRPLHLLCLQQIQLSMLCCSDQWIFNSESICLGLRIHMPFSRKSAPYNRNVCNSRCFTNYPFNCTRFAGYLERSKSGSVVGRPPHDLWCPKSQGYKYWENQIARCSTKVIDL